MSNSTDPIFQPIGDQWAEYNYFDNTWHKWNRSGNAYEAIPFNTPDMHPSGYPLSKYDRFGRYVDRPASIAPQTQPVQQQYQPRPTHVHQQVHQTTPPPPPEMYWDGFKWVMVAAQHTHQPQVALTQSQQHVQFAAQQQGHLTHGYTQPMAQPIHQPRPDPTPYDKMSSWERSRARRQDELRSYGLDTSGGLPRKASLEEVVDQLSLSEMDITRGSDGKLHLGHEDSQVMWSDDDVVLHTPLLSVIQNEARFGIRKGAVLSFSAKLELLDLVKQKLHPHFGPWMAELDHTAGGISYQEQLRRREEAARQPEPQYHRPTQYLDEERYEEQVVAPRGANLLSQIQPANAGNRGVTGLSFEELSDHSRPAPAPQQVEPEPEHTGNDPELITVTMSDWVEMRMLMEKFVNSINAVGERQKEILDRLNEIDAEHEKMKADHKKVNTISDQLYKIHDAFKDCQKSISDILGELKDNDLRDMELDKRVLKLERVTTRLAEETVEIVHPMTPEGKTEAAVAMVASLLNPKPKVIEDILIEPAVKEKVSDVKPTIVESGDPNTEVGDRGTIPFEESHSDVVVNS